VTGGGTDPIAQLQTIKNRAPMGLLSLTILDELAKLERAALGGAMYGKRRGKRIA
jgi:hypothetical protein